MKYPHKKARIHPEIHDNAMSNYYKFKCLTNQDKIEAIIKTLINEYNAPKDFLSNNTRDTNYVNPRHILFYIVYRDGLCCTNNFVNAGYHHTTFIHGKKRIFDYVYEMTHGKKVCTNPYLSKYNKLLLK